MAPNFRKLLPFGLLIPALLLLVLFIATLFGGEPHYGTPLNLLAGSAAWTLLFLIIYGHLKGWRSVRFFLIVFVAGKFTAIFYYQLAAGIRLDQLLLKLSGAVLVPWIMIGFFWPRSGSPSESEG